MQFLFGWKIKDKIKNIIAPHFEHLKLQFIIFLLLIIYSQYLSELIFMARFPLVYISVSNCVISFYCVHINILGFDNISIWVLQIYFYINLFSNIFIMHSFTGMKVVKEKDSKDYCKIFHFLGFPIINFVSGLWSLLILRVLHWTGDLRKL